MASPIKWLYDLDPSFMPLVSITRLRLRRIWFLPGFILYAARSMREARATEGNLSAETLSDSHWVYWTRTVWRDEAAMRAFRNQGAHRTAMTKLASWCDEGTYVSWAQESEAVSSWEEAHRRLVAEGTISRVNHPSPAHTTKSFPAPRR